jgi:hypothetical protein
MRSTYTFCAFFARQEIDDTVTCIFNAILFALPAKAVKANVGCESRFFSFFEVHR